MRTSRILALALLTAALTTAPAHATGETCRGAAATIVGTPGGTVAGTSGDDVVVTDGATDVDGGAGDDVICVTGVPENGVVQVRAGLGADVVDTRAVTAPGAATAAELGPGRDRFRGGPRTDAVIAGVQESRDRETDVIVTGRGDDSVDTGETGRVDTDHVDLGSGFGTLRLRSERATGDLRAAPGADARVLLWPRSPGRWVIDDRTDRAALDGRTMSRWSHFHVQEVQGEPRARIRYVGTDRPDSVDIRGRVDGVRLGGGDDDVRLYDLSGLSGSFEGGPGQDQVRFWWEDELLVDLHRGRLGTDLTDPTARIGGVEHVEALFLGEARLVGDGNPNRITYSACKASVVGGGGADRLVVKGRGRECPAIPEEDRGVSELGGPGDDVLRGSRYPDRLVGGPGRDRANGNDGDDVCRAEVTDSCEA